MKSFYRFLVVFLALNSGICYGDTIIFKSGRILKGEIISTEQNTITLKSDNGTYVIDFDEIDKIKGDQNQQHQEEDKLKQQVEELLQKRSNGTAVSPTIIKQKPSADNLHSDSLSAQDIFKKIAPATVVIRSELAEGGTSQGSGFIVAANGIIVTNFHVVSHTQKITVKTYDGKLYPVVGIIEYRPWRDLCILKIDANDLPTVTLGNEKTTNKGENVYVVGAPLGLEYSITSGIFSGARWNGTLKSIQFSAAVSPGNSGGPLINSQGEVIGIVTEYLIDGQNLNLAVPINEIKHYLSESKIRLTMGDFINQINTLYFKTFLELLKGKTSNDNLGYIVKEIPDLVEAWIFLTDLYEKKGDTEHCIEVAHKALALDPNNLNTNHAIIKAYIIKKDFTAAEQWANKYLSANPDEIVILSDLAFIYNEQGQLAKAEKIWRRVALESNSATDYNNLGYVLMQQNKDEEALENFKYAINLDPIYSPAYTNLLILYYKKADYKAAMDAAKKLSNLGLEPTEEWRKKLRPYEDESHVFIRKDIPLDPNSWMPPEASEKLSLAELRLLSGHYIDAYQNLKDGLAACGSIEKKECFKIYYKTLLTASTITSDDFLKQAQVQQLNPKSKIFVKDVIRLIESKGGAEKGIDLYRKFIPDESEVHYRIVNHTIFINTYLALAIYELKAKNQNACNNILNKLDKLGEKTTQEDLQSIATTLGWTADQP